jgi:hypothetical protein
MVITAAAQRWHQHDENDGISAAYRRAGENVLAVSRASVAAKSVCSAASGVGWRLAGGGNNQRRRQLVTASSQRRSGKK